MSITLYTLQKDPSLLRANHPNYATFKTRAGGGVFTFYGGRKYQIKKAFHFGKQVKTPKLYKGFLVLTVSTGNVFGKFRYEWRFSPRKASVKQMVNRFNAKQRRGPGWKLCLNNIEYDNTSYTHPKTPFGNAQCEIDDFTNPINLYHF